MPATTDTRADRLCFVRGDSDNHDVYDSFYIALARDVGADRLVTTDTDFADLCSDEPVEYVNPVPQAVLERFGEF